MKVVPQIITFLVILAIGWFAYERHEAFHVLVDDIIEYSGLTREVTHQVVVAGRQSEVLPADKMESTQSIDPAKATTDDKAEEINAKLEPIVSQNIMQKEPATVEETLTWPGEAQTLPTEKQSTKPEKPTPSKNGDMKPEVQATESTVKPVPQTDEAPVVKNEAGPSTERLSQEPVLAEPVGEILPANNNEAVVQQPVEARKPANEVSTAELAQSVVSRKQQALAGLAAARAAWQHGDHDKSVNLYNQLIQEYKNHPDFAGELGNIYFSKGQTELAVNAYSEAFLRLLRNNDLERAQQVLGIVYNIDQEQAALLNEYLSQ